MKTQEPVNSWVVIRAKYMERIIVDLDVFLSHNHRYWSISNAGYAMAWVDGRSKTLHSLLVNRAPGQVADHINRERLDNRRANLRVISRSANVVNSLNRRNSTGHRNVAWSKKERKWEVQINRNHRHIAHKTFSLLADALKYRDAVMAKAYAEVAE